MAESSRPVWLPDMPGFIAILNILAVVGLAILLAFRDPTGDMFKFMVGGLMTVGYSSIIAFFFGSSQGSKDKDAAMAKIAGGAPESPPATVPTVTPTAPVATAAPAKAMPAGVGGPTV